MRTDRLLAVALVLAGCNSLEAQNYLRRQVGAKEVQTWELSPLSKLDAAALAETGIAELTGADGRLETVQPDKTEAPKQVAHIARSQDDVTYLRNKLFQPLLEDKAKLRELEKAQCATDLARRGVEWKGPIGEALDRKECDGAGVGSPLAWATMNSSARVAFVELLAKDHPKRAALVNAALVQAAKLTGTHATMLCWEDGKERVGCDPTRHPFVYAFPAAGKPWAERQVRDLDEAKAYLARVDAAAPGGDEAKKLAAELDGMSDARKAQRAKTLAEHRAKNPTLVTAADLDFKEDSAGYLWHELCGQPVPDKRLEGERWVESEMLCVKVATESDGCRDVRFTARRLKGTERFRWFGTGGSDELTCP